MPDQSNSLPNFDPHLSSSLANAAEIEQEYLCWLQRQELELLRMEEDDPGWREQGKGKRKDRGKVKRVRLAVGWIKWQLVKLLRKVS